MDVFSIYIYIYIYIYMLEVQIGKEVFDCVVLCVHRHSGYVVAVPALQKGLLAKGLGGSSCMVKNEGKGRKMTGFERHQKIVVLMDISKPSQTSMAK